MVNAKIQAKNLVIETDSVEDTVVLTHHLRAGNDKENIRLHSTEFPDLYNLIVAVAQVHPEWLTNTNI